MFLVNEIEQTLKVKQDRPSTNTVLGKDDCQVLSHVSVKDGTAVL